MKWLLPVILAGFASLGATALSTAVVSMESQYKRAGLIVKGTVSDVRPTEFTLSVVEVLKGSPDAVGATLTVSGGEGAGEGNPLEFTVQSGDEYYAFLWFDEAAQRWQPVGGGQGVYRVYGSGRIRFVENAFEGGIQVRSRGVFVNADVLPDHVRESELLTALETFAREAQEE